MKEKRVVVLYILFEFLTNFCLIEQFFSSFLADTGYNLTWISSLLLIYQVTKFCFEIPTGFISDKYGRKASGYLGMISMIIHYVLLFSNRRLLFVISFFIRGLAITFISGSIESIAIESVSQEKWEKLSVLRRIAYSISTSLAAILAGILIKHVNYNIVITIDILACLLAFITIVFIDEPKTECVEEHDEITVGKSLYLLKNNIIIILLLLIDFFTAFSFIGIESLYPVYLEEMGIESDMVGFFISFQLIFAALFGLVSSKISRFLNDEIILYVFPVIRVFIVAFIYAFTLPKMLIPVIMTANYLLLSVYAPIKYSLFQKNVKNEYRATFLSYSSQAVALGGICFYIFSGFLSSVIAMKEIILIAVITTGIAVCCCSFKLWRIDSHNMYEEKT